jgi:hypothetical protein
MQEVCYCGRAGEIEDRKPVLDGEGQRALRCSNCGHTDGLFWLSENARSLVFEEAARRAARRESPTAA